MTSVAQPDLVPLPAGIELEHLLRLQAKPEIVDLFAAALMGPLEDFFQRPGKRVRGSLVEVGFMLAKRSDFSEATAREKRICEEVSSVLEALHAGSLVVDDIEDGSRVRRGEATLHLRYGLPIALNAGNFLYFWSLNQISQLGLEPQKEIEIQRLCHAALLRAHLGQALDVGVPINQLPQDRVYATSLASIELKSGALMALAISLGAIIGGATPERLALLDRFGHQFGVALQMFDDLGNLTADPAIPYEHSKRFEDLYLNRPSWVWGAAARNFDEREYRDFVSAVGHLPNESFLIPWLEIHEFVTVARGQAKEWLDSAIVELEAGLRGEVGFEAALLRVKELGKKVAHAYQ